MKKTNISKEKKIGKGYDQNGHKRKRVSKQMENNHISNNKSKFH